MTGTLEKTDTDVLDMTDNEMAWEIIEIVDGFFEGDYNKGIDWFTTENPLLGGVRPTDMVISGRVEKLYRFVKEADSLNKDVAVNELAGR